MLFLESYFGIYIASTYTSERSTHYLEGEWSITFGILHNLHYTSVTTMYVGGFYLASRNLSANSREVMLL